MTRSPVLFLIFNRPDTTAKVFEAIRQARPSKLYIAADGPREDRKSEVELCEQARKVALSVDWPCELKTLLRTENLGCKKAVSEAIDWFFEHEPEGIILEDDCLPVHDFFRFCDELLEKYREDPRIGSITGDNFISEIWKSNESYYFSKFTHIWGWATWKRAWKYYDVQIKEWPKIKKHLLKNKIFPDNHKAAKYWTDIFERVYQGQIDTWDYQWALTCFKNNFLSCVPRNNLISNIGFGTNATHTFNPENKLSKLKTYSIDPTLDHPTIIEKNDYADNWELYNVYDIQLKGLTLARIKESLKYRTSTLFKR